MRATLENAAGKMGREYCNNVIGSCGRHCMDPQSVPHTSLEDRDNMNSRNNLGGRAGNSISSSQEKKRKETTTSFIFGHLKLAHLSFRHHGLLRPLPTPPPPSPPPRVGVRGASAVHRQPPRHCHPGANRTVHVSLRTSMCNADISVNGPVTSVLSQKDKKFYEWFYDQIQFHCSWVFNIILPITMNFVRIFFRIFSPCFLSIINKIFSSTLNKFLLCCFFGFLWRHWLDFQPRNAFVS